MVICTVLLFINCLVSPLAASVVKVVPPKAIDYKSLSKMEQNELINMLIITENIIGVYRNFSFLPKRRRIVIVMRTAAEIIVTTFLYFYRMYHMTLDLDEGINLMPNIMLMSHFVVLVSGGFIILCAIQSSQNYKIFITRYMSVQSCYRHEPTYTKCLKRLKMFYIIASSVFLLTCTGNLVLKVTTKYFLQKDKFLLSYFLLMVVELLHEIRFMLEHIVLYVYITMVQSCLKCLNQIISQTQMKYDYIEKRLYKERMQNNEILTVEEVQVWAKKYECLVFCSKNLSVCFKTQMRFALVIASVHYVTSAYGIFCIILTHNVDQYVGGVTITYVLLFSVICTFFVVYASQNIVNDWSKSHRSISKLYSALSIEPSAPETKSVKNLNLLVQVKPIKIEYTNKIHIGMYLIPIVLALSLSYVITALQLSHII